VRERPRWTPFGGGGVVGAPLGRDSGPKLIPSPKVGASALGEEVRPTEIVIGIVIAAFGLATMLNYRGLAVWGSEDENNWRDDSGNVIQRQPVWVTRVLCALALAMGVYVIVRVLFL
jgi:hypothetical protein